MTRRGTAWLLPAAALPALAALPAFAPLPAPAPLPPLADAPPAPMPVTVCSADRRTCATREPERGSTLVWHRGARGRQPLWRAATLGPNLHVADGGGALVAFYRGANLLEADAGPGTPVIAFHRPGRPAVVIRLGQVVARPAALPRTVSHRQWAESYGFDGARFVLNTAEGRSFAFDPVTGRAVRGTLLDRAASGTIRGT